MDSLFSGTDHRCNNSYDEEHNPHLEHITTTMMMKMMYWCRATTTILEKQIVYIVTQISAEVLIHGRGT